MTRERIRLVIGVAVTAVYLLPVYWMLNTSFKEQADVFAAAAETAQAAFAAGFEVQV